MPSLPTLPSKSPIHRTQAACVDTHRRSPASCTIAKDVKHFKSNERRFAYELVVADFSVHTSSRTIVIVVRSDILQLITNPVAEPATLDA